MDRPGRRNGQVYYDLMFSMLPSMQSVYVVVISCKREYIRVHHRSYITLLAGGDVKMWQSRMWFFKYKPLNRENIYSIWPQALSPCHLVLLISATQNLV